MSAATRILSGTAGTMVGVLLGFAQRLLLVPVILSFWNAATFGHYLTMMASLTFVGLLGRSFEVVLGREFLRIGKSRPDDLIRLFGGSLFVMVLAETMAVAVLLVSIFFLQDLFKELRRDGTDLYIIVGAYFFSRIFVSFPGASYSGVLSCFGYFPKLTWMGLIGRILGIVAPVAAVALGFKVSTVVVTELLAPGLFAPFAWIWLRRWGRASGVWAWSPDVRSAFGLYLKSLQNVLIQGVEVLRGEGLRLVMAPLAGAASLAAFVTIRTGANVALQGLNSITAPLSPELMRFLGARDQARTEAAFATVWLLLIGAMVPGVLVLQTVADQLFTLWTRGRISFDGELFGLMSLSVLIFAAAQPAMAVVQGNNLLRPQVVISILGGVTVVGGMVLLVPPFGLRGSGVAMLASELVTTTAYRLVASKWMSQNELVWPQAASRCVLLSVTVASIGLVVIPLMHQGGGLIAGVALGALGANFIIIRLYWGHLPEVARSRIWSFLISRVPKSMIGRIYRARGGLGEN